MPPQRSSRQRGQLCHHAAARRMPTEPQIALLGMLKVNHQFDGGWVGALLFLFPFPAFLLLSVVTTRKYVSDERTRSYWVIASALYNAALAFGHLDAAPGLLQKTFECWFKEIDDHGAEWPHLPVTKWNEQ